MPVPTVDHLGASGLNGSANMLGRKEIELAVRFSLKGCVYCAQALLHALDQFTYELDQELVANPHIPIRSQSDAARVAEAVRQDGLRNLAQRAAEGLNPGVDFDDHGPDISASSVTSWAARHVEVNPEED